jgi:hypothetical protein
MSVSLSYGNKVQEIKLSLEPGFYKCVTPIDMEVLSVGVKDKELILFVISKYDHGNTEREFLVHPSEEKIPQHKTKFAAYYFYLGTVAKLGLHVFEIV